MTAAAPAAQEEHALEVIALMPEGATYEQMADELTLLEAIREGEADLDAGRSLTHEEVMRRSAEWFKR